MVDGLDAIVKTYSDRLGLRFSVHLLRHGSITAALTQREISYV